MHINDKYSSTKTHKYRDFMLNIAHFELELVLLLLFFFCKYFEGDEKNLIEQLMK